MTSALPIRCTGPHPQDTRRQCRAWLMNAVPGTVDVRREEGPPPGCVEIRCPRCGARYVVCATRAA